MVFQIFGCVVNLVESGDEHFVDFIFEQNKIAIFDTLLGTLANLSK